MATVKNINMTPDTIPPYMKLSQYDVGRVINFAMKDGSSDYTVPSGATVTLEGTKPSGLGFTIECTVVGSVAAAVTTAGMTDEHGTVVAELVVRQGTTRIGSSNVRFDIERSPHPEGTTDGSAEVIIPALTQILTQIEADLDEAEADIETMTSLKTAAETAAANAAAAQTAAQTAQTASEAAQTAAQTAQTASETAQTAAESAQTGAEAARDRATEIVSGCITIDADTSELIIYE